MAIGVYYLKNDTASHWVRAFLIDDRGHNFATPKDKAVAVASTFLERFNPRCVWVRAAATHPKLIKIILKEQRLNKGLNIDAALTRKPKPPRMDCALDASTLARIVFDFKEKGGTEIEEFEEYLAEALELAFNLSPAHLRYQMKWGHRGDEG